LFTVRFVALKPSQTQSRRKWRELDFLLQK
jgi:hypothetical protein